MSVDFFDCDVCGESVCECGDYVSCDCGKQWCSDECAEEDGFKREGCKLGYEDNDECEKECWNCENQTEKSCKYCREDDFEDSELLEYALDCLGVNRELLLANYKIIKGGTK